MNNFGFFSTFHDASTQIGIKNVVRITRKRLIPSTPSLYVAPNAGIQRCCSTICMPA